MKYNESNILFDIIESNPYTLLVIEHLKKNDSPKKKTLKQFCKENNLPLHLFLVLINIYSGQEVDFTDEFSVSDTSIIVDFLHNSHIYYKNEKYPLINSLLYELTKNVNTNEVKLLIKFFEEYFSEVIQHLDYEENIVFPYVNDILKVIEKKKVINKHNFSSNEYLEHHDDIEEKLSDLKILLLEHLKLNNYAYLGRQLIFHLYELEHDLRAHSIIEEKILIPIIVKLEKMSNV
jgi:regulator of cell morphogenesis and NO signaling